MKLFAKLLAAGIVLAGSTFAHATTLSGTIDMSSRSGYLDNFTSTGITITPSGTAAETVRSGTGSFSNLNTTDQVNLPDMISYAKINGGGQQVFTFTDANDNNVYSFFATSYFFYSPAGPNQGFPSTTFYGNLLVNGVVVNTSSTFTISNNSSNTMGSFSSGEVSPSLAPTPEPNSLILMGTGLISAAGVVMRKRRTV